MHFGILRQKAVKMRYFQSMMRTCCFLLMAWTISRATASGFSIIGYLKLPLSKAVSTNPGRISVKQMSKSRAFACCSSACRYTFCSAFVAEYDGAGPSPLVPAMYYMAGIWPWPCCAKYRYASPIILVKPTALVSTVASSMSSFNSRFCLPMPEA